MKYLIFKEVENVNFQLEILNINIYLLRNLFNQPSKLQTFQLIGGLESMCNFNGLNPLTTSVPYHIETGQLICNANQLTGFYMMGNIGR